MTTPILRPAAMLHCLINNNCWRRMIAMLRVMWARVAQAVDCGSIRITITSRRLWPLKRTTTTEGRPCWHQKVTLDSRCPRWSGQRNNHYGHSKTSKWWGLSYKSRLAPITCSGKNSPDASWTPAKFHKWGHRSRKVILMTSYSLVRNWVLMAFFHHKQQLGLRELRTTTVRVPNRCSSPSAKKSIKIISSVLIMTARRKHASTWATFFAWTPSAVRPTCTAKNSQKIRKTRQTQPMSSVTSLATRSN